MFVHVGAKPYKIEARLDKVDSVRCRCECVATWRSCCRRLVAGDVDDLLLRLCRRDFVACDFVSCERAPIGSRYHCRFDVYFQVNFGYKVILTHIYEATSESCTHLCPLFKTRVKSRVRTVFLRNQRS